MTIGKARTYEKHLPPIYLGAFDASFYDIRAYFQGRDEKGRMNASSNDETYTNLIANLRSAMKILAQAIEPKVYDYGFLRE